MATSFNVGSSSFFFVMISWWLIARLHNKDLVRFGHLRTDSGTMSNHRDDDADVLSQLDIYMRGIDRNPFPLMALAYRLLKGEQSIGEGHFKILCE